MNKAEFVTEVAKATELTKGQAEKSIDAVFDVISNTLKNGGEVRLSTFGIFHTAIQKARIARNPKTLEEISVPEKRVPKFKPGKILKDKIIK